MKKIIFLIIIVVIILCFNSDNSFFGYVDSFYIYGNHLNIIGHVSGLNNPCLFFKGENYKFSVPINYSNGEFFVSSFINDGILLDSIPIDDYHIYLKDGDKFYSLINNTRYDDTNYYTISRGFNSLINIGFSDSMSISSTLSDVPIDYYDIIIDPGHGGNDSGACGFDYCESSITLDLGYRLKSSLEGLGLRVGMTRYDDVNTSFYGIISSNEKKNSLLGQS